MSYGDDFSEIKREAYLNGCMDMLLQIQEKMEYHKTKYGFYPQTKYFLTCILPSYIKSIEKQQDIVAEQED